MTHILTIKLDSGDKQFPTKDLDFYNLVCELEGAGIDVMSLTDGNLERTKIFSTMRALLAVLINVQAETAGSYLSQHIKNGGALDDIMTAFTDAMSDAGFGAAPATEETKTVVEAPKPKRGRKTSK